MPEIDKRMLRLALAIHSNLTVRPANGRLELPSASWDACVELVGNIRRAELRGWRLAAEHLRRELGYTLPTLQSELNALAAKLPVGYPARTVVPVREIYEDLIALLIDFKEFEHDTRGRWISATTEPIVLEGVYLGPFSIRLDWHRIGDDCPYRVIAKDPHPPESRDNVTHPHIMDDRLCEGDSRHAIRQSLAQGRLLDFFRLVANGLRSYNSDSPFVALELWSGSTCTDCGCVVDDDESGACHGCHEVVCGECDSCCSDCDNYFCSQCITTCELCDDSCCRRCLTSCKRCRKSVCSNCLEEGERCSNCNENKPSEQNQTTTEAPGGAAVQPHGVGQVAVRA